MIRVAINGLGRIGRNFLRGVLLDQEALKRVNIVAINIGPGKIEYVAHLFKYDSLMGVYPGNVRVENNELVIDDHRIAIIAEKDPALLPWGKLHIDWVVECTGHFTKREGASKHLAAGAKNILISAPAQDEDVMIIPGVNDAAFNANKDHIVSLGSCTTNAFLPMLKILNDTFTIEQCLMTTVHAYTNTQVLLDIEGEDVRRSRAAAINIIPTSTGAMKTVSKVLPELKGRVEAMSLRVPVVKVSLIDLTVTTQKELTVEIINEAFMKAAANGPMKNILGYTADPLVSSDFNGDSRSVIIDSLLTTICGSHMAKVFGWYDNEWGYSMRLKDFLMHKA